MNRLTVFIAWLLVAPYKHDHLWADLAFRTEVGDDGSLTEDFAIQ